jgi:AraC family transcriptional regulator, arabinose operon regulatory protein
MLGPNEMQTIGDPSFVVELRERKGRFDMLQEHGHDSYEIYYLVKGARNYFIRNRVYTVGPGTLVFIARNELHHTTASGEGSHERILINFSESFLSPWLDKDGELFGLLELPEGSTVLRLHLSEQGRVEEWLFAMLKECREKPAGYRASVRAMLVQLLLFIQRHQPQQREEPEASPLHRKISGMAQYMQENLGDRVTLEEAARRFDLSPYYASRSFKRVTGFTFSEYAQIVRVRAAQELLRKTDDKVVDIAAQVGFEQIAHFNKVFKKVTGLSPRKYRQQG